MADWINWQEFEGVNAPEIERQKNVRAQRDATQLGELNQGLTSAQNEALRHGGGDLTGYSSFMDVQNKAKAAERQQAHAAAGPAWDTTGGSEYAGQWDEFQKRLSGAQDTVNAGAEAQRANLEQRKAAVAASNAAAADAKAKAEAAAANDPYAKQVAANRAKKLRDQLDVHFGKDRDQKTAVYERGQAVRDILKNGIPAGWTDDDKRVFAYAAMQRAPNASPEAQAKMLAKLEKLVGPAVMASVRGGGLFDQYDPRANTTHNAINSMANIFDPTVFDAGGGRGEAMMPTDMLTEADWS